MNKRKMSLTSELLGKLDESECPKCGSTLILIKTVGWRESDSEPVTWFYSCDMTCCNCHHEASCSGNSYVGVFTGALRKWGEIP